MRDVSTGATLLLHFFSCTDSYHNKKLTVKKLLPKSFHKKLRPKSSYYNLLHSS